MTPADLKAALAQVTDAQLAAQLAEESIAVEEAFLLRKWKYSEL